MSSIKDRITEFIRYKGITKYKFYKETGMTRGVLESKSGITEDNITKFIAYYPNVNLDWLIKGIGEKETIEKNEKIDKNKSNTAHNLSTDVQNDEDILKDNLLNLLVNDEEIKNAFKHFIGKEINLFASKKIMNLVKDKDFFRVITNYLNELEGKQN